jgi:hypothetical protein
MTTTRALLARVVVMLGRVKPRAAPRDGTSRSDGVTGRARHAE